MVHRTVAQLGGFLGVKLKFEVIRVFQLYK